MLALPATISGAAWDRISAVEFFYNFLDHQCQTECHQNLISMRAFIEMPNQTTLHDQTDQQHKRDGYQDRKRDGKVDYFRAKIA